MKNSSFLVFLLMATISLPLCANAATAFATISARIVPAVYVSAPSAVVLKSNTIAQPSGLRTAADGTATLKMRNRGGYAYTVSVNRSISIANKYGEKATIRNLSVSTQSAGSNADEAVSMNMAAAMGNDYHVMKGQYSGTVQINVDFN